MYAISDSGVTVFRVGAALPHRVAASQKDVVFRGSSCAKNLGYQEITITDPGAAGPIFP
jgi:hypothetical protein